MWQLNVKVPFPSNSSSSSTLVHEAHFKQSLPSADESIACMAQAVTFICLVRALTDLSVKNILERVMEEGVENKK